MAKVLHRGDAEDAEKDAEETYGPKCAPCVLCASAVTLRPTKTADQLLTALQQPGGSNTQNDALNPKAIIAATLAGAQ